MTVVCRWPVCKTRLPLTNSGLPLPKTYDVIVEPQGEAYTIFVQIHGQDCYARGTLATREGYAAVPRIPVLLLTMEDSGYGGKWDMIWQEWTTADGRHDNSGEMMSMDGADLPDSGYPPRPWIAAAWPVWIIP